MSPDSVSWLEDQFGKSLSSSLLQLSCITTENMAESASRVRADIEDHITELEKTEKSFSKTVSSHTRTLAHLHTRTLGPSTHYT